MVELIKEPNKGFNKNLFLQSLHKHREPVAFKINKVGKIFKNHYNRLTFFIDLEILSPFDCKIFVLDGEGNPKIDKETNKQIVETINAQGEIIAFPFTISQDHNTNNYTIPNNANLFSLLNYAFIKSGQINPRNTQGLNNVTFEELQKVLDGLTFRGKSVYITNTQYTPYYNLIAITENERNTKKPNELSN